MKGVGGRLPARHAARTEVRGARMLPCPRWLSCGRAALTPEAMALDLQAVVDQLALENFFVLAPFGQAVSCDVLKSLGRSSETGPLSETVVLV